MENNTKLLIDALTLIESINDLNQLKLIEKKAGDRIVLIKTNKVIERLEVNKIYYALLGTSTPYFLITRIENGEVFGKKARDRLLEFSDKEMKIENIHKLIEKLDTPKIKFS